MTGDTTYGTTENIVALEDAGIRAYVPLPDLGSPPPVLRPGATSATMPSATSTAARRDSRCRGETAKYTEAGGRLSRRRRDLQRLPDARRTAPTSDHGRQVHRSFYADYLDQVRGYHATEAYQKAMRKRQVWVEPLFAEAKGGTAYAGSGCEA